MALDEPTPSRPHRVYVALTNACNRSCPWCSTCSSPQGSTFLSGRDFVGALPQRGPFQVQLEGGEPTLHPWLFDLVSEARSRPGCQLAVLCTNGVVLPRDAGGLGRWLDRLGSPLTIKLSVNHHLLARDNGLIQLATLLRQELPRRDGQLVVNARVRPDVDGEREWLTAILSDAGLLEFANVFDLQAYGYATGHAGWETPFLVGTNFTMVNPDGRHFGPDLVARSEAMRPLP